MNLGHTRITSQGQTSVPAQVRGRYGLGPGAEISWDEVDGMLVLRTVSHTLADCAALLPSPPARPISLAEMDAAIGEALKERCLRNP
jgi:bifunctional DNA-binding transcriptional regulator/antitoxin component of YhaV-PrlF toxin-antitoxin module